MKRIVQCVPNFSEGKNIDIIKKIIEPLQNQAGFTFVSYEADRDYNRTVVTIIGDPAAMLGPLVSFFDKALELIDMRQHQGAHPRMGAVDVVPFIPIKGITINECVDYAKSLSSEVNRLLNIPIFLYAMAAVNEDRVSLPNIRQGEFEGMEEKMQDARWQPDFGPNHIHPTFGVVAIGARMPLIAFNIDLNTTDEVIANSIAKAIRKSSGGLAYVQAGSAYLEQRQHMQVTMNILDYKKNPLYRIFEIVKMEARRYKLDVSSSEVIGLIPQEALLKSLEYYFACAGEEFNKTVSLAQLSFLAIKYFGFRDFSQDKIIEAYLERGLNEG